MFLLTMALFNNVGMKAVKIISTFLLYNLISHTCIVYTAVSLSCDISLLSHLPDCLS